MTLDINELERLHAEAQDEQRNGATMLAISGPVHGTALVGYLTDHLHAILSRLKAVEEMREVIAVEVRSAKVVCEYSHKHRGCDAYTGRKMRCPDCPLDAADELEKAITAYDKAKELRDDPGDWRAILPRTRWRLYPRRSSISYRNVVE